MALIEATPTSTRPLEADLLREANHRIANHLSLIVGMVHQQACGVARGPAMLTRDQVRELLQETAGKIVSVSHLHRHLAGHTDSHKIELSDYLLDNATSLISSLGLSARARVVHRLEKGCSVTAEQAQAIGLVLSEVIMNAVKHAHPSGIPVQLTVGCKRLADGAIAVEMGDDGVGLPEGFNWQSGGGVGFRLIHSLAGKLHAKLSVESDSLGTIFMLTLPLRAED